MQIDRKKSNDRRRARIRKRVSGTANRPRLSVRFSSKHIYAQCIDDERGATLVFLSTLASDVRSKKMIANVAGATSFGKIFAERALTSGIRRVIFDRGGRKYHGCVKFFADAAREVGLSF
jgi:large subunit ribosomal protein L18